MRKSFQGPKMTGIVDDRGDFELKNQLIVFVQ